MPSTSRKQARLMAACAAGAALDKCPPPKVAKEFAAADKARGSFKEHNQRSDGAKGAKKGRP